jgi:hypothetical protein
MGKNQERYEQATGVASADGKYVLLPSGISVSVYKAATGARVQWLEGHTSRITSVALHPDNTLQVGHYEHKNECIAITSAQISFVTSIMLLQKKL